MLKKFRDDELPMFATWAYQIGWGVLMGWSKDFPRVWGYEATAWNDWAIDLGRITFSCHPYNGKQIDVPEVE